MVHQPLVSIITIVYNGEKYIEGTIQSVLNQTYPNIEYIVIDGGSTDNTIDIIDKYHNQIAFFLSEKDNGISDAFNKGIRNANGEIIGIINADDWYESDAVATVVEQIDDYDISYGDLRLLKNGKTDFVLKGDHNYLKREMTINHPTVFVKKKCYDRLGLFDEQYKCAMDYDLVLRFLVNNCRFKYISKVIANMRMEGFSNAQWLLGCKETLAIKNKYIPTKKIENMLYFYKHIFAIALPRFLQKMRMGFVVKGYRAHISKIKKLYE
ncbi:MAG: glycosyltransferase [Bacteroidetes bacterium]|nr:glycosyltransferase [Bacteroidota bacterium]